MPEDVTGVFYTTFQPPSITAENPMLRYRDPFYWSHKIPNGPRKYLSTKRKSVGEASSSRGSTQCYALVFPCLSLDIITRQKNARADHKTVKENLSTSDHFTTSSIHFERTLDEAYYPALAEGDIGIRNDDQVITRSSRKKYGKDDDITPILMVPQLWLWAVGPTVISAYSMTRESGLFLPWQREVESTSRESGGESSLLRMGLILASHIDDFGEAFLQENIRFPVPSALDIFQTSVVSVLSQVNGYLDPKKTTDLNLWKEKDFIHDIWDIRSELTMIQEVLEQQQMVLDKLLIDGKWIDATTKVPKEKDTVPSIVNRILASRDRLLGYQNRIGKIQADAERIDKAVESMLNLKRTFAGIKEAHNSIILNAAVVGFTVITIIFAPLSFLVGLFALPTHGVRKFLETKNETKDMG
ncbi:hypothetical protein CC80DRAFT_104718 [Byssothecium circinans]|uniref:Cora-domain-containing protein n=1 Tax=Byssothecium circinans TaxID=147558 RepID=A0A6A5UDR6_9PLEO|nr:hypothetical protein CC80DRAFT_104718 [Byssothecium circinans]